MDPRSRDSTDVIFVPYVRWNTPLPGRIEPLIGVDEPQRRAQQGEREERARGKLIESGRRSFLGALRFCFYFRRVVIVPAGGVTLPGGVERRWECWKLITFRSDSVVI